MLNIQVKLADGAIMPEKKTAGASGYDLHALYDCQIPKGKTKVISVGVAINIKVPFVEAVIRPRSSMSKKGILCHTGTIDNDYNGADDYISVTLTNTSTKHYYIEKGDRIAQLVFQPTISTTLELNAGVFKENKNRGGYGSTGK